MTQTDIRTDRPTNRDASHLKICPPGKFLLKFLQVFYISREKQKFSRSEVEGGKVGRLDVGKIGRFEGGKARKNLRKVAVGSSLPSSLLIPSTIPSLYLPHKNFSLVTFGHQSSTKYTALRYSLMNQLLPAGTL